MHLRNVDGRNQVQDIGRWAADGMLEKPKPRKNKLLATRKTDEKTDTLVLKASEKLGFGFSPSLKRQGGTSCLVRNFVARKREQMMWERNGLQARKDGI